MVSSPHGPKTLFDTTVTDVSDVASGTDGTGGRTGDIEGVGTIRQEGENWYRWVQNAESSDMVAGMPVCYDLPTAGTAYHQKVYIPLSATLNTFAGIAMGAIPALGWGWIQIEGYNASCAFSAGTVSVVAGVYGIPANAASTMATVANLSVTINSVSNQMIGRVDLAASISSSAATGGSTSVGGFIHCLTV